MDTYNLLVIGLHFVPYSIQFYWLICSSSAYGTSLWAECSAVSISRLSLKDRALEEQISNFKPLFALAPYPSLFPFTNVWAVVFRTGCTEGHVFGACPVLVLEVCWRQARSSFWGCKIVLEWQRTGFVSPWDLLASQAPYHIREARQHPRQSQVTSALAVQRRGRSCMSLPVCDHRPTQNLLIHASITFEWLFM